MNALKAHVENGRIVLDEPMDLPDGTLVQLVPVDGGDEMDAGERAALGRALDESIADARAGRLVDADVVIAELLARP
jgi:hypothetical protein